jgi:hypothetical protein
VTSLGTVPRSDSGHGDVVDHNRYSAVTASWGWAGTTYSGWSAYRRATGLDAHSTLVPAC